MNASARTVFLALACVTLIEGCGSAAQMEADLVEWTTPRYTEEGRLMRPPVAEQWVFLGSALNLNYDDNGMPFPIDVMSTVLMEPTAYRHFLDTGEFREGTMTALLVFDVGTGAPPLLAGQFQNDLLAFEMSVKDSERFPDEAWAYYRFATPNSDEASAQPSSLCWACHTANAETDHVFTQFYPSLP